MRKSAPSSGGDIVRKRQNEEDSSEEEESPLVVEERAWLSSRLDGVLSKVRNVLAVFRNDALADDDVFEEILQTQSLNGVLDVLRDVVEAKTVVDVFRSFFTDDEWSEMEASDRAIGDVDEAQIRLLRLKRQHALLFETRDMAIDLTAIQNEGEEQETLVNECVEVMNVVMDRSGINQRGNLRRIAQPRPPPPVKVRQKAQPKAKKMAKPPKKRKNQGAASGEQREKTPEVDRGAHDGGGVANDGVGVVNGGVNDGAANGGVGIANDGAADGRGGVANDGGNEEEENVIDELGVKEMELEVERLDMEAFLAKAKSDVAIVAGMLNEHEIVSIKIGNLSIPDPKFAAAESGASALLDDSALAHILTDGDIGVLDESLVIERWGTLVKWWRLVNRSFGIAGLFESLRSSKQKGTTLCDRYQTAVARLQQPKVYSFTQAAKYDRLGKFLVQFPGFVYQLQLVSLADWLQETGEGRMIKCLGTFLSDEEKGGFWKEHPVIKMHFGGEGAVARFDQASVPAPGATVVGNGAPDAVQGSGPIDVRAAGVADDAGVASDAAFNRQSAASGYQSGGGAGSQGGDDANDDVLCLKCSSLRPGFELWQCYDCGRFFHEMCMGYNDGTICADIELPNGNVLETLAYCQDCLIAIGNTVDDVAISIEEVKAVGRFLNAPNCPFVFEKIAGDGYCCFRILEKAARKSLGWKEDQAKFCRQVAKAAVESAEAAIKEIGADALEGNALQELKKLARHAFPVESIHNGAWKQIEAQHILRGYVNMFRGRVVVKVYQATNGNVRNSDTYGKDGSEVELSMLHWNTTDHYDCLVAKKK